VLQTKDAKTLCVFVNISKLKFKEGGEPYNENKKR